MGKLYLTCGDFILNSNNMDAIVNAQNKLREWFENYNVEDLEFINKIFAEN